jgi:hypothetical protein
MVCIRCGKEFVKASEANIACLDCRLEKSRPDLAIRDGSQICWLIEFGTYFDEFTRLDVLRARTKYPNDYFINEHGEEILLAPLEADYAIECEHRCAKDLFDRIVNKFSKRMEF